MDQDAINAAINDAATQYGIDPSLLATTAKVESDNDPNAVNASGQAGLFQFSSSTAKQYGLTNRFDPAASASAAAQYYGDISQSLSKSLGRTPTNGELYLGYQQGPAGASALLKNPNANAVDALTPIYGSANKAAAAVTQNGGSTDMTAGQFANMWTSKMPSSQSQTQSQAPQSQSSQPSAPGISLAPAAAAGAASAANGQGATPGIKNQLAGALLNNLSQMGKNMPSLARAPSTNTPAQAPQNPQAPGIRQPQSIPLIG